ncbi:hypothetical protein Tco_0977243 [Tanacetum coccineum]|uniref:Retrovirus-related Pol polyprotein from transposon TNT 1-94-like beta-barrel domain-containing protein n=1 Tax=Tanacetum coccineum TaxID=301880 RepID=A0ABQ5EJJ8_9ASTR
MAWVPKRNYFLLFNVHDNPERALKNKEIVDSGCSRHMTGNKAYLVEYQDYNGGPIAFGGSKGYITSKGVKFSGKVTPLFDFMLVPHQAPEGEGSQQPSEPQPTPSHTQHSTGDQPPMIATSSSHDTTQDSRDSLEGTNRSEGDQVQPSHDSPLLGGPTSNRAAGGMTLEELYVLCTNLSNMVLSLEASKDAQAAEIIILKIRIKKLKKKSHPVISHHRAWLRSVSRLSMKRKFGRKEFVSKQGRKNAKPRPTLDAFDDLDTNLAHGMEYMDTKEAVNKKGESTVSTVKPERVSTAGVTINTVDPKISVVEPRTPPTTTSIFDDEDVTMAQTLIKMKQEKSKEKGVAFKDVEDSSRPARSILTLKPLPMIDPKDKGKGILQELELAKKMAKSDFDATQIARDAEIARHQAPTEERKEYTIEERVKFLAEKIAAQRKFRAAQRSAKIRSRPPTKSKLINLMMTYLKNMGGNKHSQLKAKSFEEIKGMYERQKKSVQDFVPIGSAKEEKLIKKMNEKANGEDTSNKEKVLEEPDSTKVEVKKEGNTESTRKRPGRRLKMKATKKSKRQKTDSDLEEEEQLKDFLMIVPDEEGEINYEVLNKRYPIINWVYKFYHTDRYGKPHDYYRVFRANGSLRYIKTFTEMVSRIMFEANTEDDLWKNQEEWILKSWNFYDNCGVHILVLEDGTGFCMLAERSKLMNLEAMMEVRRIFKCWFYNHTTNGHQFTMSNRHQELASPEQTTSALAILEQTVTDGDNDWKPKNAKDDKVTKEFKFIKEQIKE